MFKFLKDKFKDVVDKFSKKVEEEGKEVKPEVEDEKIPVEQKKKTKPVKKKKLSKPVIKEEKILIEKEKPIEVKEEPKKKSFFENLKDKIVEKPKVSEELVVEAKEKITEEEKKKSFFESIKEKVTTKKIDEKQFDEFFWDIELGLMENNVATEVIDKIKDDLKKNLVDQPLKRGDIEETIKDSLKKSLDDVLSFETIDLIKKIKESEKPFVIIFFGINGAGKTTTIAKVANLCQNSKLRVVLGAADSFRSAAIEQLEMWGKKLNVKVVKHKYGADPAAICFDTISYAKSHDIDVVLLDTAGRQHSNKNLMDEMKKIVRVAKPNFKVLIAESIVGNDSINQSQEFNKIVGIDGIILTKSDVDEKGGAILSISYVTQKPVLYLGCGQNLADLKKYKKEDIMKNLGF